MITKEMYLGLRAEHVSEFLGYKDLKLSAQSSAIDAFKALQQDAKKQGFDLEACSAFRSFERQAAIFTAKFMGQRPILDINEEPLDPVPTDPVARLKAMLIFSAMPGFSRHHFGSDFDVYAPDKLPEGQSLQLTYHEYLQGSYFFEFGEYLKTVLPKFDFFNPYASAPLNQNNSAEPAVGFEPWHISHAPSAYAFLKAYDVEEALSYVSSSDLPFAPYVREVMTPKQIESMLHLKDVL